MTLLFKKIVIGIVLCEGILFCVLYVWGPHGLHVLDTLRDRRINVVQTIQNLEQDIENLEQCIVKQKTDFAKEKIARERLLMKKNNETIFFKS